MSQLETVSVRTVKHGLPETEPLSAYVALAERYGRDQVYLLESAAGPEDDCHQHLIGFRELLALSVTTGAVHITGAGRLREMVLERIAPLVTHAFGEIRLRSSRSLWNLLRAVHAAFDAGSAASATEFNFGFVAYFGYDTAHYIEDLPYVLEQRHAVPDVHLVLYQGLVRVDLRTDKSELLVHQSPHWDDMDIGEVAELLTSSQTEAAHPATESDELGAQADDDTERDTYLSNVDRCLQHIAVGDIYQVQIGHELTIQSAADPLAVYRRLRARNASPYMYVAPVRDSTVVGASPELFVRVTDGEAVMRPIAGTVPRGATDDEVAAELLRSDPKEIAEHVMLVDLCRNDIGRICQRDTLDVREQMKVEQYSHVLHLVSTVVGRVASEMDSYDVIAALFPSGTMTGAPKIRAMEIIESIETRRRGLYAGALGVIGAGGYVNLALCIRTLIHHDGAYHTRSSAGVVADSDAGREWTETLAKSSAAYWAVTGRELLP